MKKKLALLMSALLAASMLAGCGGSTEETTAPAGGDTETTASAEKTESTGDNILTVVRPLDSDSLDPILINYGESVFVCELMYDTLFLPTDDGSENEINKDVCDSYEMSEDGMTWTFHLKEGVKFSDGTDVTSADWQDTFQRCHDSEESIWKQPADPIVSMETPDDYTLIVNIDAPRAAYESELSLISMSVQCKADHDKYIADGGDPAAYQPVGTGPFMVKEWKRSEALSFEKNPNYTGADPVYLDGVVFKVVPDDNARVNMLKAGEADVVLDLPYSTYSELENTDGINVIARDGGISRYMILNNTIEPLNDKRVREALRLATDRQQLVDMITYGFAVPSASYLPPGDVNFYAADNDERDVEKAKELLKEAGYENGIDLELLVRSGNAEYEQIATIIKEQWAEIGVNLTLTTMENASIFDLEEEMKHEIAIGRWTEDINDPSVLNDYFWNFNETQGYYTGYHDTEMEQLSADSAKETDPEKRAEMYKTLQEARYNECSEIPLYNPQYVCAVSDKVDGFVITSLGKYRLGATKKN